MSSSGRTRADEIVKQMKVVPTAPCVDTEYVAKLLADEASRRRQSSESIGITAYTRPLPSTAPKEVNKTFLSNTIRGVDSHNRREQIDDCWRAHRLNAKLDDDNERQRHSRRRSREGHRGASSSYRRSDRYEGESGRINTDAPDNDDNDMESERAYILGSSEGKEKKS